MAISNYRGFNLQSGGPDGSIWKVKIKNHVLQGSLTAVKKSIDWWCDTASIIDPKEFASLGQRAHPTGGVQSEVFNGYTIKNDTGEPNGWYCMFNGKLIKGGKAAIQRHIEAYLVAKQKAVQAQAQQQKK
ncbi:TPA: DUF3319 domain-containing protein [Vibrio parahaemolyticus]|uniref:DUF3319 domain-containing protein n=1 Tax=Vibrio parahaemolyticus TaxID=670 RepID=UPI0010E3AED5|nr:DUF3319 domain-containing protein [Vibrio parahaemolyticus]EHK0843251.1 DUF3319 domain-containing protein [Vibrio parahaemolyticus]EII2982710.1 DUF3319 domain-containing protein [Vibrio parahaemolyticus]EII3138603.1 DUF3319 domain-containing protein [Vibrio parahaemolyticus]EJE4185289.1 DUF3319 domain-containing protein [Vibrio parahaemolyticus]EJG0707522.1 DUF3319 domain-containing protein [Vibrio parahaemolyticus]